MGIPSYTQRSQAIVVFMIACLGHFIVDFSIGLWPIWKTIAHYDLATAGLIAGFSVIFGESMQSVFSIYADRGYWRSLIGVGCLIASASLAMPLTSSLWGAGVLFLLTCLGSSAFHPTAVGLVSSIQGMNKTVLIAIFHTSGLLGLAISQALFSSLYEQSPALPLVFGILPAVLAVFLSRIRSSYQETSGAEANQHQDEQNSITIFVHFLKRQELRSLYFLLLANQIMTWSILFLLPDFLIERKASMAMAYGGGHFIYVIGAAFTCVPLGALANRLNTPLVILITYAVSLATLVGTLCIHTSDSLVLGMLLFALGGSIGAITPLSLAVGNDLETKRRAMVSAFLMGFVWIFSEGIGYSMSSYVAACFSEDAAAKALAVMGLALALGLTQAYSLYYRLEKAQKSEPSVVLS